MKDIITEATRFIAACYGHGSHDTDNMSALRFRVWASKMSANRVTSAPELKTLPPTTAFEQHVRRAHYQTMVWRILPKVRLHSNDTEDCEPNAHADYFHGLTSTCL